MELLGEILLVLRWLSFHSFVAIFLFSPIPHAMFLHMVSQLWLRSVDDVQSLGV